MEGYSESRQCQMNENGPDHSKYADQHEQINFQNPASPDSRRFDEYRFESKSPNKATFPHTMKADRVEVDCAHKNGIIQLSPTDTSYKKSDVDGTENSYSKTNVDKDPLAGVEIEEDEDQRGQLCELHTYEVRFTSKGEPITLQVGSLEEAEFEEEIDDEDRSPEAALVLKREYERGSKELLETTLLINSPFIKSALRNVVKSYPGVNLESPGPVLIFDKPRCLFHYRTELKTYAEASDEPKTKQHVEFCLKYMERPLRKEMSSYEKLIGSGEVPGLDFANLWMAFRPGDLLYQRLESHDIICRLRYISKYEDDYEVAWAVNAERVIFDGNDFVYTRYHVLVEKYDGYRPFSELKIFPLKYLLDKQTIVQDVLSRGKKYASFAGIHYKYYEGVANVFGSSFEKVVPIFHRIMIDCREFYLNVGPHSCDVIANRKASSPSTGEDLGISNDDLLICSEKIPGFSLAMKKWCYFDVAKIDDVRFDHAVFDKLVLSSRQKDLISSLVEEQQSKQSAFEDLITGKGKGLILLLHGEPGVGKTLTAESIAENTKRPLYTIGCGDLGNSPIGVERELDRILRLATKWKAIVLIDEADVFMEKRNNSDHSILRNGLVSVLLRTLEYFEGIMFLTTNRISSIDTAFESRIHLSIAYPPLSFKARQTIWQEFIMKGAAHIGHQWFDTKFLERVASKNVNGRQIRNIVQMACALAAKKNRSLRQEDILVALDAFRTFDDGIASAQSETRRIGWSTSVPPILGKDALRYWHHSYKFAVASVIMVSVLMMTVGMRSSSLNWFPSYITTALPLDFHR